jgi:biopolymer transport protein ExbD
LRRIGSEDDRILPLINVVFLLLIFFMVAGRLAVADPFRVEPPRSANGVGADRGPAVVLIGADGRLALDGASVETGALAAAVAELRPEAVRVKADGAASAGLVVGVLRTLREAGVRQTQLLTIEDRR